MNVFSCRRTQLDTKHCKEAAAKNLTLLSTPQENHELRLVELEKQCDSSRHIDKNAYGKNIILLHTM